MPLDASLVPLARFLQAQRLTYAGRSAADVRAGSELFGGPPVGAHLLPGVASVEDVTVPGGEGPRPARVYRPADSAGPMPTVVFFHGGGFVLCSLDTHDVQCRELCRRTGSVVVSVDYRLAPEAPFPAAVEDALAATRWAIAHSGELGGDASRVAVAGDSAGGNLAAVICAALRGQVRAALLLYPVADFRPAAQTDYPSFVEHASDGILLTAEAMAWFAEQYIPPGADAGDPRLSPLLGDLAGLPPTVVTVAELDPLADQGRAHAAALARAGVPTTLIDYPGLIHGYFALSLLGGPAEAAVAGTCAAFAALLHSPAASA